MALLGVHFLVNFFMLALPLGATLGILFGIDASRASNGQTSLYNPNDGNVVNGGGSGDTDELITTTYCQTSYGITPTTDGQEYTLNPNQWGWDESEGGGLCMNVTTYDNGTYPTNTTAPAWTITWEYPQGPETQPVHAFPNIKVDGDVFPATVESLSKIVLDVEWNYGVGNVSANSTDETALDAVTLNANVAVDMFFDSDKESSSNSSAATYEVMVWLADFGTASQPIGLSDGAVTTAVINTTTFSLYTGTNSESQNVLTWVASTTADVFYGDILELVTALFSLSGGEYPSKTDYIGYLAFGSEAYYSDSYVTFSVPTLSIDIE